MLPKPMDQSQFVVKALVPEVVMDHTATRPGDRINIFQRLLKAIIKAGLK
jgi:hypothetical protein